MQLQKHTFRKTEINKLIQVVKDLELDLGYRPNNLLKVFMYIVSISTG